MNLVSNAFEAMPGGGTIEVRTLDRSVVRPIVGYSYIEAGDYAILEISDTGVGIAERDIDKIFEPYFTTKDFGSGIGLTMVYKVVKEHMGDISVSSRPDKGTTFMITFPIPQREKHLLNYSGDNDEV